MLDTREIELVHSSRYLSYINIKEIELIHNKCLIKERLN